jgi:hypothetical protein
LEGNDSANYRQNSKHHVQSGIESQVPEQLSFDTETAPTMFSMLTSRREPVQDAKRQTYDKIMGDDIAWAWIVRIARSSQVWVPDTTVAVLRHRRSIHSTEFEIY